MKIKVFLYFPETDAAFEMLHNDPDSYKEIVKELFIIKSKLKENADFELYFDSANISNFLQVASGLMPEPHLSGIRGQLTHVLKYVSIDVNTPRLRNLQCIYANWEISISVINSPYVIAESAESKEKDSDVGKTVCVCLGDSLNACREKLHIIKDAIREIALPKVIYVDVVNDAVSFVRWITTLPVEVFKLAGNVDFEPLDKFWKKERIYRHKKTGNHWYFDFFHKGNKIHYEVFDNTGNQYLGEADIKGNLVEGTNVGNKKISHIL